MCFFRNQPQPLLTLNLWTQDAPVDIFSSSCDARPVVNWNVLLFLNAPQRHLYLLVWQMGVSCRPPASSQP